MAELRPLLPLMYNSSVVGSLSDVIAPPYDVITAAEQEMYRRRSPYNAIHIELPVAADGADPYQHAWAELERWKLDRAVRPAPVPSMFLHRQEFTSGGRRLQRDALVAGIRLEPWSARVVIPHEDTFAGPKQDRLQLFRSTGVAPSTLFGLYEQPQAVSDVLAWTAHGEPTASAEESDVTHTLWAISEVDPLRAVAEAMSGIAIYMADGHHRYETSLAYREERRAHGGEQADAAYNFVAMSLVAFDDPGLLVLPTHRVVAGVAPEAVASLRDRLGDPFTVEPVTEYERTDAGIAALLSGGGRYSFLYFDGDTLWRLSAPDSVRSRLPSDRSEAWQNLDLAVLHEVVLCRALGMDPIRSEEHLTYTRDVPAAFGSVSEGSAQAAFFVRPTGVEQLRAVADARDKMPHKSTYFYPKFPSGLLFNQLEVELPALDGAR